MSSLAGPAAFGEALTDSLVIYLDLDQSGLGPTPPEVTDAVLTLLGPAGATGADSATGNDIYAMAADMLSRFLDNDPSERTATLFVAYVSTFFHEARHVHDLLSTGFGLDLLAAQFNCYQNALPLAGHLYRWQTETGRPVPLPIRTDHPAIRALPPEATRLIERYGDLADRMARAGAPDSGIYSWMTDIHLLEASAGMVQLDITHDLFGADGLRLFYGLLRGGRGGRKYLWLINDFMELAASRGKASEKAGRTLAFLLWTALQGCRGKADEAELSPVAVFHAAADFVTRNSHGAIEIPEIGRLLDALAASWKLPKPATTLRANRKRTLRRTERFLQDWQRADPEAPRDFADIFSGMKDAYLRLTQRIEEIPDLYFAGRLYAHAVLAGELPALRVDLKSGGTIQTFFTRGRPCLTPETWDKAATYAATLNLLLNGPGTFPIPHVEERAFAYLRDRVELRFEDALFL